VTLESLNGLTYLDAVVREILRYHPPVEISAREAQVDDIIPLENGFVGRDGKFRDHIEWVVWHHAFIFLLIGWDRVKKGDRIFIPVMLINRMKEVWGDDADEFK
jgi:cytochrome P450